MERAEKLAPIDAAAEAVKTYLRMHSARAAEDPELLALLLPARFKENTGVHDYQRFVIEKLLAENAALKAEVGGLRARSDRAGLMREGVRRLVLDLIEASTFDATLRVAAKAAEALHVARVSLSFETDTKMPASASGAGFVPHGFIDRLIEPGAVGVVVKGPVNPMVFGDTDDTLVSAAIFRLRLGPKTPPALFAAASGEPERFDDEAEAREIGYFVRALERSIRAWFDLPPIASTR